MESVRRYRLLAIAPVVVLVAAALVYGLQRSPKYTAESRLAIGRIDVNSPGALAGFAVATQSLASTYSRAIDATSVTADAARRTHLSDDTVRARLSATPVPASPVFRVIATGPSARAAIDLSNAGNAALRHYIKILNGTNPNAGRLYRQFRQVAVLDAQRAAELATLRKQAGATPDGAQKAALANAQAEKDSADLQLDALRQSYQQSQSSQSSVSLVQLLTKAASAKSDRTSRLEIALFAALVGGALLGIALATSRANRITRFFRAG